MRLLPLVILIVLFSCRSSKKTSKSIDLKVEKTETVISEKNTLITSSEDLTEVIIETITNTIEPVTLESGEVIEKPVVITQRKTERFQKKTEEKKKDETESVTIDSVEESETEDVYIETEAPKGLFSSALVKIALVILVILAIVFKFLRKRLL